MSRIQLPTSESIPEDLRDVFDEINAGPGGVGTGPMSILKHSPEMARRAIPFWEYVRNESTVPHQMRELAMLATARAKDCIYIWDRHVPIARQSGLSNELIDALRDRRPLPELSPSEAAIINLANEFFNGSKVSDETFQAVHQAFGTQAMVELVTLMGYYAMLAFNANTVDLQLAHESDEPLLPV
ncbi:MAG: carboxymuconolactone decarboxylase family protein [Chloroflexota bacterium]|nr:carboxymuconolactone decarboxylase family protein [Chloroflexota bacterium]